MSIFFTVQTFNNKTSIFATFQDGQLTIEGRLEEISKLHGFVLVDEVSPSPNINEKIFINIKHIWFYDEISNEEFKCVHLDVSTLKSSVLFPGKFFNICNIQSIKKLDNYIELYFRVQRGYSPCRLTSIQNPDVKHFIEIDDFFPINA